MGLHKQQWMIYLLMFISFLLGVVQFIFNGILDQVATSLYISVAMAGQLTTAFSLGSAIGTPIMVVVLSRVGRKQVLLGALSLIAVTTIGIAIAPYFSVMLILRVFMGAGFGIYGVAAFSVVARIAEKGKLARATANLALGTGAALVAGVPVARILAANYDWRYIFWGVGLLMLPPALILLKALPKVVEEGEMSLKDQLGLLKEPKILLALAVTLSMFISYSVVTTYTTPYLSDVWNMSVEKISLVLLIFGIASVVGAKLGGHLSDHLSPGLTLSLGMFAQAACLILVLIAPKVEILAILFLSLWALAAWTAGPILNVNMVTIAPGAAGILLSLNSSFVQFGFAGGAAIGGIAVEIGSISTVILIGAVAVAISALLGLFAFKNEEGRAHRLEKVKG